MNPIILFESKNQCSGCGACMEACSQNAIDMRPDENGFLYPILDSERCVNCGNCITVCPFKRKDTNLPMETFAAVGKDAELVDKSASGGVFATLAKNCVSHAGAVAGAVLQFGKDGPEVFHILSDKMEDVPRIQGSKYVQSDAYLCYNAVIQMLKSGKTVLFSGTPCQVQAVKRLTKDPENLITMDIICHGVPSAKMFKDFLAIQGKKFGGVVSDVSFRDKSSSKSYTARLRIRKGKREKVYRIRSGFLSYYRYFLEGANLRESCYNCPFASIERAGDLTAGDYWGVEKHHADACERKSASCVLVNTEKGKLFLQYRGQDLQLWPTQLQWIADENRQLNSPSKEHPDRATLFACYQKGGYGAVEQYFIRKNGGWLRFFYRMAKSIKNT